MSTIYFRYGTHSHAVGECKVLEDKETIFSADGVAEYTACRWDVQGMLVRATQAEITSAIASIRNAYAANGKDAGLYFTGGGATGLVIKNANTIRGVRVVRRPHFPAAEAGQYSTFINYALALEWEESPTVGLVSHSQAIEHEGDGGADWGMVVPVTGGPLASQKTERTPVTVCQSGVAVGSGGYYPVASSPIWGASPPLHGPSTRTSYRKLSGPGRERETSWSYTFIFPSAPAKIKP